MEHTKLPWRVSDAHGICIANDEGVIADLDERLVAEPKDVRANAEFIVKACNSHDELVKALEQMDDLIKKLWDSIPWGKTFDLPVRELNEAPLAAAAALARAKGESR